MVWYTAAKTSAGRKIPMVLSSFVTISDRSFSCTNWSIAISTVASWSINSSSAEMCIKSPTFNSAAFLQRSSNGAARCRRCLRNCRIKLELKPNWSSSWKLFALSCLGSSALSACRWLNCRQHAFWSPRLIPHGACIWCDQTLPGLFPGPAPPQIRLTPWVYCRTGSGVACQSWSENGCLASILGSITYKKWKI